MGFITLQELFDSQCHFDKPTVGLLNNMINIQQKYHEETINSTVGSTFSEPYYKELKELADTLSLNYTEPKFRQGLQGVDSSPVYH